MEKAEEILHYFEVDKMYNPFLLKGMDHTLKRIVRAINNREKIVLYGYYDVDSIISMSIIMLVLKYLNADVEYFIPDHFSENFEISPQYINNSIKYLGADLLLAIGCGTNSEDGICLCEKLGIDVIIVDYHMQHKKINNVLIVNPNQDGCKYPFKELVGCGIVFKLCQAISTYYDMKCINKYLDLVAVGVISKTQRPYNENKILIEEGLKRLVTTNNYGINALIKLKGIKKIDYAAIKIISTSVEPTLNAVGRMDNAKIAVELFTTSDSYRALQIAKYLNNEVNGKQRIANVY
ncbi:delta(24)-sterol C-methyltransferase [Clostridium sp. DMHC 10]|uniref:DHH family phosphoesterase n=1 Tax=Clostridium sp. DMHC 10 TaxID=747377 RepID=UPI00069FAC72|nr:DHH family phosphoesterase [Clostridium sp. DMHC 10]KOF55928.1 delta(24)-sterol C-methyltransferase [Clostridium sp. DMHC 10]